MALPKGTVTPGTFMWGANHREQTVTLVGSPQGGTWTLRYRGYATAALTYAASSSDVQTAVRTLPDCDAAIVTRSGTGLAADPYIYAIVFHESVSIVEPLGTRSALTLPANGSAATYAQVVSTEIDPLFWNLPERGHIRPSSVAALAARTLVPGSNERAAQTKVTEVVIEDLFGGLGIRDYIEGERVDRFYDGDALTPARKRITLPPKRHTPTYASFTKVDGVTAISAPDYLAAAIEYAGVPYGIFMSYNATNGVISHLAKYTKATNTWTQVTDGAAAVGVFSSATSSHSNDLVVYRNVLYWANGTTSLRRYDSAGNTLTTVVTGSAGVQSLTVYDLKLVRIDTDGAIYYATSVGGAWTTAGNFAEESSLAGAIQIQCIRTWRDIQGTAVIYVVHSKGIHQVDIGLFEVTKHLSINGVSSAVPPFTAAMYQGDLAFLANGILRYNLNDLTEVGAEREQGLPQSGVVIGATVQNQTKPVSLYAINNWLFASYSWKSSLWELGTSGHSELGVTTILAGSGGQTTTGMVLGYNGRGWHPVVGYTVNQSASAAAKFGNVFWWDDKLFYGNGNWITWPDSSDNPSAFAGMEYESTGNLIISWLDKGLSDVLKAFYWTKVRARDITSTEVIKVRFQLDNAPDDAAIVTGGDPRTHWVPLVDKDGADFVVNSALLGASSGLAYGYFSRETLADGVTTEAPGVEALMLRLWYRFERGSDPALTPVMESSTITLDVLFDPLFGFGCSADLSVPANGRLTDRQIADVYRLHKSTRLQPFAYSDDDVLMVRLDQFVGDGFETGYTQGGKGATPVLNFLVSERLGGR